VRCWSGATSEGVFAIYRGRTGGWSRLCRRQLFAQLAAVKLLTVDELGYVPLLHLALESTAASSETHNGLKSQLDPSARG
jgi:hypothetical protein